MTLEASSDIRECEMSMRTDQVSVRYEMLTVLTEWKQVVTSPIANDEVKSTPGVFRLVSI